MEEFITRGLGTKYVGEIKAWQKYYREQKFAKKLDKQMREEVKRFKKDIKNWTPKELEEIVWDITK